MRFTILNVFERQKLGKKPKKRRKVKYTPRWCPCRRKLGAWKTSTLATIVEESRRMLSNFLRKKKRVSSPASGITTTSARAVHKERMCTAMFSWMTTCAAEIKRPDRSLSCELCSSILLLSVMFFSLYFGKTGITYNCLVYRPRKAVTGGTAGTSRSCNRKIRMGNFIVRSANELLFSSEMASNGPVKALIRFFTNETENKWRKREEKKIVTTLKAKCHHNEAWPNSLWLHPKTKVPPPLAISQVCHGKETKWPLRENHEPLASRTS